ncbi:MAG: hypothetical protein VB012_03390 [Erysipelotrichaceae bacterium]|nr:hypothetical protein [Erysipelotrichaceae bacterium]
MKKSEKPVIDLKNSRQGIIWSIILADPKSKQPANRRPVIKPIKQK